MLPKNDREDLKTPPESREQSYGLHSKKMSQGEKSAQLPLGLPGVSQMGNTANAQSLYQFHAKPKSHLQAYNGSPGRP